MCMYGQLVLVIQPCCSNSLSYVHVFNLYFILMNEINNDNNNDY